MTGDRIGVFVATMTGLAEAAADEVCSAIHEAGFAAEMRLMEDAGVDTLAEFDVIVIVSSTHGHGDVPDNGHAFFECIEQVQSLAGKSFAVYALGDRTYSDTFCNAGEKFDKLLALKGATRIAPLRRHDASSGTLAEDEAGKWAVEWITTVSEVA